MYARGKFFNFFHILNFCTTKIVYNARYYDFQLSKAWEKFGHKVLTFKLPCCQGQLAPFPKETAWMITSDNFSHASKTAVGNLKWRQLNSYHMALEKLSCDSCCETRWSLSKSDGFHSVWSPATKIFKPLLQFRRAWKLSQLVMIKKNLNGKPEV